MYQIQRLTAGIAVVACLAVVLSVASASASVHHVDIGSFFFAPAKTTVQAGDTVRWTMVSGISHTTTSQVGSPKAWDSGLMGVGDSVDVVFTVGDGPGPFPYLCSVHPFTMIDTIFMAAPPPSPTIFSFLIDEKQANACAGTGSSASGFGVAVLRGDSSSLSFYIEHDVATVTDAHVHFAGPCVDGGVSFPFSSGVSPIVQTWALSGGDVTNLFNGDLYVNIHSSANPGGEIRGQIVQSPIKMAFTLNEAQADAGLGTGSCRSGLAIVELNAAGKEVSIEISHDIPSDSITDGHLHLGDSGAPGAIQFGFTDLISPIEEVWSVDTLDIRNLLGGGLYVNLHTVAVPGGEIRGQVRREAIRWAFEIGEAEAAGGSGTGSSAVGICILALSADHSQLSTYCEHDVVMVADAHLHLGAPGVSGPIVFGFASPISPINETWDLTASDLDNLLAGDLYMNIHSMAFPAGEIRGQVDPDPVVISFDVDEAQAEACAGTGSSAVGSATIELKPGGREMTVNVTHNVSGTIDGHIHLGLPCTNGGASFGFGSADSPIKEIWYLGQSDIVDLMKGSLYVNIHSTTWPAGEIRGQLVNAGGCCVVGGDVDGSGGIDVSDLGYIVDFLFRGGPPPPCDEEGDVDGSGGIDVSDLGYIVDFLFRGGPPPPPCP